MAGCDPEVKPRHWCASTVPESPATSRLYRCISLLLREMDTFSKLKQFDAYPKTLEDFRVKTWGGATGERLKCSSHSFHSLLAAPASRTANRVNPAQKTCENMSNYRLVMSNRSVNNHRLDQNRQTLPFMFEKQRLHV